MTIEECAALRPGDVCWHESLHEHVRIITSGVLTPIDDPEEHPYGVNALAVTDSPVYTFIAWGDCLSLVRRAFPARVILPNGI